MFILTLVDSILIAINNLLSAYRIIFIIRPSLYFASDLFMGHLRTMLWITVY